MRLSANDMRAEAREARMIEDFLEELQSISHRCKPFIDRRCGIRAWHDAFSDWLCPMNLVYSARTGYRSMFSGPGHLMDLHRFYEKEMRMGTISWRLADAIDNPDASRNESLARSIKLALGIKKGAA